MAVKAFVRLVTSATLPSAEANLLTESLSSSELAALSSGPRSMRRRTVTA
jgi:hypothetical protein